MSRTRTRFPIPIAGSLVVLALMTAIGGCGNDTTMLFADSGASGDAGASDGIDCAATTDGAACGTDAICVAGDCRISRCGDGFVDPARSEACDDGNEAAGDGCEPSTCRLSCETDADCDDAVTCNGTEVCNTGLNRCQAGVTPGGEAACELDAEAVGVCSGTGLCVPPGCGNETTEGSEQCDDGSNGDNADGCKDDCTFTCDVDLDCNDGDACNGDETCSTTDHVCAAGAVADCDDSDECTADSCDAALGCRNEFIDGDNDAFSPNSCLIGGSHEDRGDDCDDANNTVHPDAAEMCNGGDDDCDTLIDEGTADLTCFRDADADGYGNAAVTMTSCSCPAGFIPARVDGEVDCRDIGVGAADIHPDQTGFFASGYCSDPGPRLCFNPGEFDYDCDGVEQRRWTRTNRGSCSALDCLDGWTGSTAPACGDSGNFRDCSAVILPGGVFDCITSSVGPRTQECR